MVSVLYVVDQEDKLACFKKDSFFVINIDQLTVKPSEKDRLDRSYLNCLAKLAKRQSSRFWWANVLSEKNELLSAFYSRLMKLYLCEQMLREANYPSKVVIVCSDCRLTEVLRSSLIKYSVKRAYGPWLKLSVRNGLRYPVKACLNLAQAVYRSLYSKLMLNDKVKKIKDPSITVIKSWIDERSHSSKGQYQDAYFGDLIDYLQTKGSFVIWGDIIRHYSKHIKLIARDQSQIVIPTEYYLRFRDITQAFLDQIHFHRLIKDPVVFEGIDIKNLVNDEIAEGFFSLRFFDNILYFYKAKALAQHLKMKQFIYTFENYAWEKMTIAGLSTHQTEIKTIGFQHAFIGRSSFKYFLGEDEYKIVPKPTRILTLGHVTARILTSKGWDESLIKVGCALRQAKTFVGNAVVYGESKKVLVIFPMMFDESVAILNFINEAGLKDYSDQIILRFHPQTPLEQVLGALSFDLPKNFIISKDSLRRDFEKSGIVLYTVSTVGAEALAVGLPVVYLDLNLMHNLDPLYEWEQLKGSVHQPKDLKGSINHLLNFDQEQYQRQYELSREYLKEYFYPVTETCFNLFTET